MNSPGRAPAFRLLFVCTGNICRSPFAELLTAHFLAERLGPDVQSFALASAGTKALVGAPIHAEMRRELEPWKLDGTYAGRFIARQLDPFLIDWADIVLTATPEHRVAVLTMSPQALPKAFALREFVRLAESVPPGDLPFEPVERAHALVERARARRGAVRAQTPADDAIPDPIGRNRKAYQQAATLISDAVQRITGIIAL